MQESNSDRYLVSKVLMLAVAFAVAVPAGVFLFADAAAPVETSVVMVQVQSPADIAAISESGAQVVHVYDNGFVLTRATKAQAKGLVDNGLYTETYTDRTVVNIGSANLKFDTANGDPALPANLVREPYKAGEAGRYLVQFAGPADSSWQGMVEGTGAKLVQWMGTNLCMVKATPAEMSAVGNLAIVEWTGVYQPAYKMPQDMPAEGVNMFSALVYDEVAASDVADQMVAIGATVNTVDEGNHLVSFSADIAIMPTIAHIEGINFMSNSGINYPADLIAGEVHYFHHAWYTAWSGLPVTLTGTGQRLHIQDTGFDEGDANNGNPDWFDGNDGDRVLWFTDRTGNSVPDGLWPTGGGVSHGTHCTGIATGAGYNWESYLGLATNDDIWHQGEAGVAPESMVGIDGCAGTTGGLSTNLGYIDTAFTTYQCYVSSNSWGSANADYSTNCVTIDDDTDTSDGDGNQGRIVVFAAGNDGPDYYTMGDYAMMKNGFGIGACENYRPDRFSSDNPNMVADFSSRAGPDWSSGRIKPDLLATGTSVISAFGSGEYDSYSGQPQPDWIMAVDKYNHNTKAPGTDGVPDYAYMQGTSMACPMAAGLIMLTREYFQEVGIKGSPIAVPTEALIKAALVNGADPMNPDLFPFPGYDQGWGRINLKNSLFPDAPRTNQYYSGSMASAQTITGVTMGFDLAVESRDTPLVATIAWIDLPGEALSRNLNLRLTDPDGIVWIGNNYGSNGYTTPGTATADAVNIVEQISVAQPEIGTWTLEVIGTAIPTAAPFAVVFSADVGGVEAYAPDLKVDGEALFSTVVNGKASQVYTLLNFGTSTDSISLAENGPFACSFSPAGPYSLAAGASIDVTATYTATALALGVYDFEVTATSGGDGSKDTLNIRGQVLANELPKTILAADSSSDEKDPSVCTFYDGTNYRIFITYLLATVNGQRVMVKHSTINPTTHEPVLPWNGPYEIGAAATGDYLWPNDPRITYMPDTATNFKNRVLISFSADDLVAYTADPTGESSSSTFGAYADLAGNYATWTNVRIDINTATASPTGYKRVQVTVARPQSSSFVHVFEHLDYDGDAMEGVGTHMRSSTTGGASWNAVIRVSPADANYYFFPNAAIDQNGIVWVVFYWRTPTGNDRDLLVRLTDGVNLGTQYSIWDTSDNVQFPAVTSTAEGAAGNRVYITAARDAQTVDFKIWTCYYDGDATLATNLGTDTVIDNQCVWGTSRGPFGTVLSDANYNRRPVLVITGTGDGFTWVPYMEASNPYGDVNMYSIYSSDGFATVTNTVVTADPYAKGHQMASSLTITGSPSSYNMYEVFHASHGSVTEVNYDIYLIIYHEDWENDPDTTGPTVTNVAANPNPYDVGIGGNVALSASILDYQLTPLNGAEYKETADTVTDPTAVPWTGTPNMTLSGATASETASATIVPSGWSVGQVHRYWVRGRDTSGNWGTATAAYVDVIVVSETAPYPPVNPFPADDATSIGVSTTLSCYVEDPQASQMDVRFYNAVGGALIGSHLNIASDSTASTTWSGLVADGRTYTWYAIATDRGTGLTAQSETWSFTTTDLVAPTAPSGLTVERFGPGDVNIPTVETRYLRGVANEATVNGLTAYSVGMTNSATEQNWGTSFNVQITVGIRVFKRSSAGTETEITSGTPVATVNRAAAGSGYQTATWTPTLTALDTTDSIVIKVYADHAATATTLRATFTTGQLGATQLDASTWTVQYWTRVAGNSQGGTDWYWGSASYNNNIVGFGWSTLLAGNPADHNTLNWTASASTDVVAYNIYRSASQTGPWTTLAGSVPGTQTTFVDMDHGQADGTLWWYVVRAEDGAGNEETNTASVQEQGEDNQLPTANAGPDQSVNKGVVTFNGAGSTDPDGTISTYSWAFTYNSLPQTLTGVGPTFNFQIVGVYTVTLTVTDNLGGTDTDTVQITINNQLPVANAGIDQTGTANYLCTFNGAGSSDPDGTISTYNWAFTYDGSPQLLTGVSPTFNFQITGVYTVTLTVTDSDGATDDDTMTVTVNYLTHNVAFTAGWNLLSFAVNTEGGKPLATVFANEWSNIQTILYYDAQTGDWKQYDKSAPSYMNDLKFADESKGYWVKFIAAGDGILSVQGKALTTTTVTLRAGWNLVGCPDNANVVANTALAGTGFDLLMKYSVAQTYLIATMAGTENMVPGNAYWVHVPAATSYVVTY